MLFSRIGILGLSLALILSSLAAATESKKPILKNPLPLTRVALITDLDAPADEDDPGTGGAFDNTAFFQNKLADAAAISVCVDQIETAAATWAKTVGLSRSYRERQTAALMLHYVKSGLPGLFSVSYDVEERVKARVRVDYFRLDGAVQRPEAALDLESAYQIAGLQDDLDKAIACKGNSP